MKQKSKEVDSQSSTFSNTAIYFFCTITFIVWLIIAVLLAVILYYIRSIINSPSEFNMIADVPDNRNDKDNKSIKDDESENTITLDESDKSDNQHNEILDQPIDDDINEFNF